MDPGHLNELRQLRALADDAARMPIGCDCGDCYRVRSEIAERANLILKEFETSEEERLGK